MREYWDKDRTLEELSKIMETYKIYSWLSTVEFYEAVDPFFAAMARFHFGSVTAADSALGLSKEDEKRYYEAWNEWRRKGEIRKHKKEIMELFNSQRSSISIGDAMNMVIQSPEFKKCKTKKDLRLLTIKMCADYNIEGIYFVEYQKELERRLWTELAKVKRKQKGIQLEGEVIDSIEYPPSTLFKALSEELFGVYARSKGWKFKRSAELIYEMVINPEEQNWEFVAPYLSVDLQDFLLETCSVEISHEKYRQAQVAGLPDFLVWKWKPKLGYEHFFVEVKANESKLSKRQQEKFKVLARKFLIYVFNITIPDIRFKVDLEKIWGV